MFPYYSSMSPAQLPRLRISRGGTNDRRRGDASNVARMSPVLRPIEADEDDAEIGFGTVGNFVHVRDDSKDNVSAEEMTEGEKTKRRHVCCGNNAVLLSCTKAKRLFESDASRRFEQRKTDRWRLHRGKNTFNLRVIF